MKKTIAKMILTETTSRTGLDLYRYLVSQMEKLQVEKDQDWDTETTFYTFKDGSKISDHGGDLKIIRVK